MDSVVLTEREADVLKRALEEAQAVVNRLNWLASTGRRITRDDILLPGLQRALENAREVNLNAFETSVGKRGRRK